MPPAPYPGVDPLVSVIIPVSNAAATLEACLDGVRASTYAPLEVIVVDDHSTDGSYVVAQRAGVQVISIVPRRGAAFCRNRGTQQAQGEILVFVDADVVLHPDAIQRMVWYLQQQEQQIDAVFGLYTAETPATDLCSRFKNLQHHYVHLVNAGPATTFWTGCGGIWRSAFESVGGFDNDIAFMEDINLGYKLTEQGYRIVLVQDVLCTHLKKYSLLSLIRSDLVGRAIPWTRLILAQRGSFGVLNTSRRDRMGILVTALLLVASLASLRWRWLAALPLPLVLCNGWLNRDFLRYAHQIYGPALSIPALLLLHLYYINCGTGFVLGVAEHIVARPLSHRSKQRPYLVEQE